MNCEYSKTSKRIFRSEIRELLKYSRKPGMISFGGGLPDAALFPVKEIAEITGKILDEKGYLALQYGPTAGEPEMVEHGFGTKRFDAEGRTLILHYPEFVLYAVYFPNGQKDDERLQYKLDFYDAFLRHCNRTRKKGKPLYSGTVEGEGVYAFGSEQETQGRSRAVEDVVQQVIENSVQGW